MTNMLRTAARSLASVVLLAAYVAAIVLYGLEVWSFLVHTFAVVASIFPGV